MTTAIEYVDRKSGQRKRETVYAAPFLYWLHNTRAGVLANDLVLRYRLLSRWYGWWNDQPRSSRRIRPFVDQMQVDASECSRPIGDYRTFNEFFTRELRSVSRPVAQQADVCVAPVDGKVMILRELLPDRELVVKNRTFRLDRFLGSGELAEQFSGGDAAIIRLALADYHHVHFPADGVPDAAVAINGSLYGGGPYAERWPRPFYNENYRMRTLFRTDRFGLMAMVEIGAFTVGSIRQSFVPNATAKRGDCKSVFALGGSTVVLIFTKGMIDFDQDLIDNSSQSLETRVLMGETIGRRRS